MAVNSTNLEFSFIKEIEVITNIPFCEKHQKHKTLIKDNRGREYYRCACCKIEKDSQNRRDSKSKIIEAHGGCCIRCGYNKTPGAMEFHHRDPKLKKFSISSSRIRCLKKLFNESKKCILLCANCHREIHAGLFDISEIEDYEIITPPELLLEDQKIFDYDLIKSIPNDNTLKVPIAQLDRATAF